MTRGSHSALSLLLFLIAAIFFFAVIGLTFSRIDVVGALNGLTMLELTINGLLGILFTLAFGYMLRVGFRTHYDCRLSNSEILTLPLMMQLFTYLLPLKGGVVFQAFYMRHRHGLELSGGFSLGISIFLISVFLATTVGLLLNFSLGLGFGPLFWFLSLLGGGLVLGLLLLPMVGTPEYTDANWIQRGWSFLFSIRDQLVDQVRHPKLMIELLIWSSVVVIVQAAWFQQTGIMLGFEGDFQTMLLVTLVLRIVLLIRLLPGNLGVQELLIGLVFSTAGLSLEEGLLVALVNRIVSTTLAVTIGMLGLYDVAQSIEGASVKQLIARLKGR